MDSSRSSTALTASRRSSTGMVTSRVGIGWYSDCSATTAFFVRRSCSRSCSPSAPSPAEPKSMRLSPSSGCAARCRTTRSPRRRRSSTSLPSSGALTTSFSLVSTALRQVSNCTSAARRSWTSSALGGRMRCETDASTPPPASSSASRSFFGVAKRGASRESGAGPLPPELEP